MDTRGKPAYDEDPFGAPLPDPPGRQRGGEFRLVVAPRQRRHRLVIIGHVPEGRAPDTAFEFENRVTRIRGAGFHDMRKRMDVTVAGRADTAGIDDHPPVG